MQAQLLGRRPFPWLVAIAFILALLVLFSHSAEAASTSGGGLPYEDWLTKIRASVTGPIAYTLSILALVGAGSALIWGGDMNGFLRTLVLLVLVFAFLVAAQNTLSAITGQGALISSAGLPLQNHKV